MQANQDELRIQFNRKEAVSFWPLAVFPTTKDERPTTASIKPTHWAVWQAENEPVVDGGSPPRPFRHFRLAERCTPDRVESSPRSFGVGSKIGYHHHQPGRPAFSLDARGNPLPLARGGGKIVGNRLATMDWLGRTFLGCPTSPPSLRVPPPYCAPLAQ
jgi:hypothetical protein